MGHRNNVSSDAQNLPLNIHSLESCNDSTLIVALVALSEDSRYWADREWSYVKLPQASCIAKAGSSTHKLN